MKMDAEYIDWIQELKRRYQAAQIKAAVKVNSEQLLFNWQLGRDLVIRRAEEKWGKGVVEQVSLDMQAAFPGVKGFSARNLWFMKQWYSFYASNSENKVLLEELTGHINIGSQKLKQLASEIQDEKLKQVDSEFAWMFHGCSMDAPCADYAEMQIHKRSSFLHTENNNRGMEPQYTG